MLTSYSFRYIGFIIIILLLTKCNSPNVKIHYDGGMSDTNSIILLRKPAEIKKLTNYNIPLGRITDSLNLNLSDIYVEIDKSDYTLSLLSDSSVIKQYPVVFGDNPVDDKLREGDRCTPEGNFKVVVKYPHRKWSKFILIDYPNAESLKKFNKAKREGIIPPESTPGGSIGIHGVPDFDFRINIRDNWTLGCISLKNKDINEIYNFVEKDTRIFIRK
jgi:murein L,D-transpeptidase YafK